MSYNVRDALLNVLTPLPNGAGAVTSAGLPTGKQTAAGHVPGSVEYLITPPALTTGQLPNAATMTYDVVTSASANLASPTVLMPGVIVQTGAGGVGAAAPTPYRFRLPSNAQTFVGVRATNGGAGNASGASVQLEALV